MITSLLLSSITKYGRLTKYGNIMKYGRKKEEKARRFPKKNLILIKAGNNNMSLKHRRFESGYRAGGEGVNR